VPVRDATPDDLQLVARVCTEGFADDPVMTWVFQDVATRQSGMAMAFTGLAHSYFAPGSAVHVVDDACVTLWRTPAHEEPPGVGEPGPSPFPPDVNERFRILGEIMQATHPHEPHWYLNVISTLPSHRGQGLGARALEPVLAVCDAEGMPAYLESSNPRNMSLYRRHGFEQVGELPLPDGPALYPMWRTPR
jgi:ribosomal protein S18 acetylase RimI-like enzyme